MWFRVILMIPYDSNDSRRYAVPVHAFQVISIVLPLVPGAIIYVPMILQMI